MLKRVAGNAAALTVGRIAGDLANFVLLILVARMLGATELGVYGIGMALGAVASLLVAYGWPNLVVREIAAGRQSEAELMGTVLGAQLLALVVVSTAAAALWWSPAFPKPMAAALYALVLYQCLLRMLMLVRAWFNAHEEAHVGAWFEAIEKLLALAVGLTLLAMTRSLWPTLAAFPIAAALACSAAFITAGRRYGWPRWRPPGRALLRQARLGAPLFALLLANTLLDRAGVLALSWFHEVEAVGLYTAADRLLTTGVAVLALAGTALQPAFARLWTQSRAEALLLLRWSLGVMLVLLLPVVLLCIVFAEVAIVLLFGEEYRASAQTFRILAPRLLATGLFVPLAMWLLATGAYRSLLIVQCLVLLVYAGAVAAWVPSGGATSLAQAQVAVSLLSALLAWAAIRAQGYRVWPTRRSLVALAGGSAGLLLTTAMNGMSPFMQAGAVLAVYLLALGVGRELHPRRWRLRT